MNLNRDEFLLLSRTGRGPHSTRAGPRVSNKTEPRLSGRLFRRSTRPSRTPRYVDEPSYHDLEFLVGFPADEETLR